MINATIKQGPFTEAYRQQFPAGSTIADMVRAARLLESRHPRHLLVRVNGEPRDGLPPTQFGFVRPKSGRGTVVTIQPRLMDDGAFDTAGRGLNIGTGFFGAFGGPTGALFGPIASIIGGSILETIQGFIPIRRPGSRGGGGGDPAGVGSAGIGINPLKIYEPLPEVFGTKQIPPPLIAPAWTEQRNDKVFVNALFGVEGQGTWSDVRVNGVPIGDVEGAVTANTEGAAGDANLQFESADLPTVVEEHLNYELGNWDVVASNFYTNTDSSDPTTSRPSKPTAKAKSGAKEIWLNFLVPNGTQVAPGDANIGQGLRISMRKRGDTAWRFLPYVHLHTVGNRPPFRFHLRLKFEAAPGTETITEEPPFFELLARWLAGATLTRDGGNEDHVSDAYFGSGIGGGPLLFPMDTAAGQNVDQKEDHLVVYLDPADATDPWDIDEWEIRVDPGGPRSPRREGGGVFNYHNLQTAGEMPGSAQSQQDENGFKIVWASIASVFPDDYPVAMDGVAQLFVRLPNIQINEVTAVFSRKLPTWSGTQWTGLSATDNPAAVLRHIWTDDKLADPYPPGGLDDVGLGAFYDNCVTQGLKFNAYIENDTVHALAARVCKLAKAKPVQSAKWGVWFDKDRSAEAPAALVTTHNARGFKLQDKREKIPHGYKVRFFDKNDEYRQTDRIVYRTGFTAATATDVRAFDGTGLVTAAEVDDVVGYLLDEFVARGTFVRATLPIEGRLIDRGNLVAISADTLGSVYGSARIVSIQTSGVNVTGLTLSNDLPLTTIANDLFGLSNIFSPTDIFAPGNKAGVTLVYEAPNPQVVTKAINETADTDAITFVTPFATPANLKVGSIVAAGPVGQETRRMYVVSKRGLADEAVEVTCFNEANSLIA